MELCERIERMAKDRNESIYSIEKKLEIGNGTIGKWKGNRYPSVPVLKKLATHFEVPLETLLGDARQD